jgi:hypothetical protein
MKDRRRIAKDVVVSGTAIGSKVSLMSVKSQCGHSRKVIPLGYRCARFKRLERSELGPVNGERALVFVEIIRISDVEEMGLTSTAHDLWYVNFPRLATNGRRG